MLLIRHQAAMRGMVAKTSTSALFTPSTSMERCNVSTASQHDNNPKILEEEKHKALNDETTPTNPDHPNWNEKLASTAEAVVKADGIDMPIEELQDFTIKSLHGTPEEHASMKEEDLQESSTKMATKMALVSSLSHSNASTPVSLLRPDGASSTRSVSNARPAPARPGALITCRATAGSNGSRPAVQEGTSVHVKLINNVKYVTLEQARAMVDEVSAIRQRETLVIQDKLNLLQSLLDNADADRERLDRELRRAQQDQVAKDKRIKSEVRERLAAIKQAEALRTQLEELEAKQALLQEERARALARAATAEANVSDPAAAAPDASTAVAVLAAGEALEQRLKVAYEKQYTKELAVLREQLKQAQELTAKAEAAAAAARTDAELRVVTTAEEAIETLEVEAEAELQLAKVAAVNACEAANAASLNAKTALEGQQEALRTAQAVRLEALAAEQRAQEARAEADALGKEVEGLREKLEAAHKQAADAVRDATTVEAESLQRAAAAEAAAQARLDEALAALETLKAAAEQRAAESHQRAEQYHGRVAALSEQVEGLRHELAVAQEAVAQADARSKQLEEDMAGRLAALEAQANAEVEEERKLLATEKAKLTINARDLVVAELDGVVNDMEGKLQAVQQGVRGQLESVQRALRSMTQERDYWKRRGQQLEQDVHTLRGVVQMEMEARATDQGPAAAVAMKTVAAFFNGDSKAKAAAAAIGSPKVQGGRTGSPPGGRMQTALPQRRLWELFASGSNTEEEALAMQDLPEGQFHDDEEDLKEQQEANKAKPAAKGGKEGKKK